MKKITILFHGECWDGFGGGYAAWKKFGDTAEYFGLKHGFALPDGLDGKEVYIVDFSFKEDAMADIIKRAKKVVALDHHVSAEKSTKMAREYVYALDHSGAVIAWKYFHPDAPVPLLLQYVEDVDIWKWKLPKTAELMAYMGVVEFDFETWDKIAKDWDDPEKIKSYVEKGEYLLKYEDAMTKRLIDGAMLAEFEGHKTLVVNSPVLHSEIGMRLTKLMPPIAITWSQKLGINRVSLRSDGTVDVAKLAGKYGGGGHKAAAGFAFPMDKSAPWKITDPDPFKKESK